tara:strand:+ start:3726 stop:4322 length:597 start_codon:yes stop_codon:yes gene_type:complete
MRGFAVIQLALLRHGHTSWNRLGRIQGRTDIELDDDARAQLAALRLPAPWDQAGIVSSPLSRAVETAKLVSGRTPETCPALTEMDWGTWEGRRGVDLIADPSSGFRDIEYWGWHFQPPNGDSPDMLRRRLLPWVTTLNSDTVAICHIGVMRVLLAHATGWDFDGPAPFQIKRNRLYLLEISPSGWRALPDPIRLAHRP